ncbi:MAG: hypothetical protein ACXAC5_12710 [Promethearchaeota archaeon]|jgi:hypothetical protein
MNSALIPMPVENSLNEEEIELRDGSLWELGVVSELELGIAIAFL